MGMRKREIIYHKYFYFNITTYKCLVTNYLSVQKLILKRMIVCVYEPRLIIIDLVINAYVVNNLVTCTIYKRYIHIFLPCNCATA